MNNSMHNAVLQFLLKRWKEDKLDHSAILAASEEFNVHRRTVSRLWKQASLSKGKSQDSEDSTSSPNPVLGSLLHEGPIRMITQGQELTTEADEKTLADVGFKDNQMVYISMGVSRGGKKRDSLESPSLLPPPPRESIPTLLLLRPNYFEQLFGLMHTLSTMKTPIKGGQHQQYEKFRNIDIHITEPVASIMQPTNQVPVFGDS